MKALVVAHGHPTLHKGGGEVAAYSLHRLLRESGHQSVFVGWGGQQHSPNGGALTQVGEDDYLLFTEAEHFKFSSTSKNLTDAFEVLLAAYKPDVVHLHHYLHLGIETASVIKKLHPGTKVILTLHEYLAICANNGQLFTKSGEICDGYKPERCTSKCFPTISPATFFMREIAVKSAFGFVDEFISPSDFLARQYIAWGIPADRMSVIENPLAISQASRRPSNLSILKGDKNWKVGFFGQINFYKGLDIVVDGIRQAREKGVDVKLGIHGNFSTVTGDGYIDKLKNSIELMGEGVQYHGPYAQADVQELMQKYDFVVMGSRWFENSPVVIQEAINAGVPLLTPNHGGMVEKAMDVGISYRAGDASDLSSVLQSLQSDSYDDLKSATEKRAAASSASNSRSLKAVIALYD